MTQEEPTSVYSDEDLAAAEAELAQVPDDPGPDLEDDELAAAPVKESPDEAIVDRDSLVDFKG